MTYKQIEQIADPLERIRAHAVKDSQGDKRTEVVYNVMRTESGVFYMDQHFLGVHRNCVTGAVMVVDTMTKKFNAKTVETYQFGKRID